MQALVGSQETMPRLPTETYLLLLLLLLLQEPTQAELDPAMQALVVSQETIPGGEAINAGRASRGFEQLQLVVVGLIGGGSDSKLSSTALREADAAAAATEPAS
jgi:phosphopantetheine adenylyltransferase